MISQDYEDISQSIKCFSSLRKSWQFSDLCSCKRAMESDEDDPVEQEIDVYLTKHLSDSLYLLQYPLRPVHKPYPAPAHLSGRIKPAQHKLEMTLAIDTRSSNFDQSKGEQIAVNVDGNFEISRDQQRYFEGSVMDKQVLTGCGVGPETSRYVVGVYREGELFLTPVKSVMQIRPGFGYMDKSDARQKTSPGDGKDGESSQDEEEARPVTVKFARHESAEAKARRMASYDYLRKQQEEEDWIPMDYLPSSNPQADILKEQLTTVEHREGSEFHLPQEEYLHKLMPPQEQEEDKKPDLPTNVLSISKLKSLSFNDQVRALLINAKVMRFSHLLTLLPKGSDSSHALRSIQQVALLVQGCWVVKSEELYPVDSCSAFSGVPAETLSRGRDYIMWRFTQNRYLLRKDISSVIKLPAEDVKDILEQIAHLKVHHGWEFMWDTDNEFVHRHPEVVQRQNMLWEAKFQQLSSVLNISKGDIKLAAHASAVNASPKRRRTVSRTKSGGFSDMSDTDGEGTGRQRGASGGRERRRNSSGGPRQRKTSHSDQTLQQAISNGSTIPDHAPPLDIISIKQEKNATKVVAQKKELQAFVKEKLSQRFVLTISDLRLLLNMRLAELPPGHVLAYGISDKMLEEALVSVSARRLPSSIYSANQQGFAIPKLGDSLDPVRKCMLDIICSGSRIKMLDLKKRIEQESTNCPSEAELRKVMKEYCFTRGAQWHVKGTLDS